MADYNEIVTELLAELDATRNQMREAAEYYEATHRLKAIGLSTPPSMSFLTAAIGWPRMYLDSIEERLDVEDFRLAGESTSMDELREWWQINSLDEESGLAHLDALVYGRSYITVAAPGPLDPPGIPIIRAESPLHMYAETDPRTRKVTRAVRVYQNPADHTEKWATLYFPNSTVPLKKVNDKWVADGQPVVHNLGAVPVVPIINRERLGDRDGRSEITPELRSFTDAASRVVMNMQAAAELMAVPQRVLFGVEASDLAPGGTPGEVMDAYLAQILALENAEGKAFQFQAAELMNFVNVLQELAKHVASYTGLPPQYLSFSSENPASAEAIRSAETRLVKKCERKARLFGGSWEQVMRLATLVVRGSVPLEMSRLETMWRDPSTPTQAAKADAATKVYGNGQGPVPREQTWIDMGYSNEQRVQMKKWVAEDQAANLAAAVAAAGIDTSSPSSSSSSSSSSGD